MSLDSLKDAFLERFSHIREQEHIALERARAEAHNVTDKIESKPEAPAEPVAEKPAEPVVEKPIDAPQE